MILANPSPYQEIGCLSHTQQVLGLCSWALDKCRQGPMLLSKAKQLLPLSGMSIIITFSELQIGCHLKYLNQKNKRQKSSHLDIDTFFIYTRPIRGNYCLPGIQITVDKLYQDLATVFSIYQKTEDWSSPNHAKVLINTSFYFYIL